MTSTTFASSAPGSSFSLPDGLSSMACRPRHSAITHPSPPVRTHRSPSRASLQQFVSLSSPIPEVGLLISKEQPATTYDPIFYDYPLPLVRTFHPLGFSLELSTNSPDVLLA